jgi:hypothetical protein
MHVSVNKGAYDKAVKNYSVKINGSKVYRVWKTLYTRIAVAGLRNLQTKYTTYRSNKHKKFLNEWPPHSLFCEKRCCQRAFNSYHKFLRKEIKWGRNGHLIS